MKIEKSSDLELEISQKEESEENSQISNEEIKDLVQTKSVSAESNITSDRIPENITIEKVSKHELSMSRRSQFAAPTSKFPMCFIQGSSVNILPAIASSNTLGNEKVYEINYVKKPSSPNWSFTTGTLGQYVYDSANSVNFEISDEDQSEVILRILTYAGVVVRDTEIIQAAAGAVSQMDQQQQQ